MKKNKMMRLASSLLVAVLLTSSVISGTFAKYVTSDTATDKARVAKWGVYVEVTGEDAFATMYETGESPTKGAATDDASGASVVSAVKVLAPGTHGTLATVDVYGKPEVTAEVTVDVDLVLTNWKYSNEEYFPVKIYVGDTPYTYANDGKAVLSDFVETVEDAIATAILGSVANESEKSYKQTYKADTVDFGTKGTDVTVSWEWPFSVSDVKDTHLGNMAADANEGNDPTITFTCTVTVEQVD